MNTDLNLKVLRYRWLIFALLALGYILVYFHRLCPAVLAVEIMRDLKTSGALAGLLGAAYFYPYALMQLPAGLLSDSWGPRKTITLFFLIAAMGSIILGLSMSVTIAIIGRTLVGIGVAMLFVPTLKILSEWFRANEFAFMTGILMAMGGIGSLTAATPLVILSTHIGWRNSFMVVGLITLLLALLVWIFVRNRPSDLGWPPVIEHSNQGDSSLPLQSSVKLVLTNRYFWPLAIWFFFDCGIFFGLAGLWGGPFLRHIYHMDKAQSGHILSMVAFGMVVGSPFLSFVSDRIFQSRKKVMIISSAFIVVLTGLLAAFTHQFSPMVLYLYFFFLSIFSSAVVVIGFTMNKELFPIKMAGTSTGLINLFPFAGGAVFQPLLGYVLERYPKNGDAFSLAGYKAAFGVLFISAIIALGAIVFSKDTLNQR